jgi:YD repeat-containing protein
MLFGTTLCSSQVNTDLRPQVKSPEVNKFEQYMNMPVNLVSGTPQVSIPLYTLEYGGMKLPISLDYDASGVKVESIASSVGQNWSLNVGGVVSRIVKGAPDEGPNTGLVYPRSLLTIDGFFKDKGLTNLYSGLSTYSSNLFDVIGSITYSKSSNRADAYYTFLSDLVYGTKDSQPDLFYFSTPEGASKFVFNSNQEIVYTENTDFVVNKNFVSNRFNTWNITSPNGIKYKYGLDTDGDRGMNNAVESSATSQSKNDITFNFIVNSWFLTEISNYTNDKKISISYLDSNYKHTIINNPNHNSWGAVPNFTYPYIPPGWDSTLQPEMLYNAYGMDPYRVLSESYNVNSMSNGVFTVDQLATPSYTNAPKDYCNNVQSKVISQITAGDTQIIFNYSSREDLIPYTGESPTAKRLDNIIINDKGVFIKKIKFDYTYAISNEITNNNTVTDIDRKRLFLTKIVESNNDETIKKPYDFVYNQTKLPNKLSYAQDKWGYYNGKLSNPTLYVKRIFSDETKFADRKVDFNYAKAGSLEKIIYPTKGTIHFEFEPHSSYYLDDMHSTPVDSVYNPIAVRQIISDFQPIKHAPNVFPLYPYNTQSFTYDLLDNQFLQLTCKMIYPKTWDNDGVTQLWCDGQAGLGLAAEIIDLSNNTSIYAIMYENKKNATIVRRIDPARFKKGGLYELRIYGSECYHNITALAVHEIVPTYDVGGLRIKKIKHKDYDDAIVKEVTYTYFSPKLISNPKPFFKINFDFKKANLALSKIDPNLIYLGLHLNSIIDYPGTTTKTFNSGYYYFISSKSDPFDINFMGPHISYTKVIESDGNGNTINEFNDYKSYKELLNQDEQVIFPAPPKMQSILGGNKKSITITDSNNAIVSIKNTNYNYIKQNTSISALNAVRINLGTIINVYTIEGQTKTLKTETETTTLKGQDVTVTKDYEYTGVNHYQPTKITTTNSKGSQLITKMYYPNDVQSESLMQELIDQNRKSSPVRTENYNGTVKLSEQKISYAKDATTFNLVLPKSIYAAKFPNSLATIPGIGTLERKVTSDYYDTSGNLTQYTPEGGAPVSIVWGNNKTQPIAKIENATNAQLVSALGVTNFSAITEAQLSSLNNLRTNAAFSQSMITTYTYQPLVGVSSITDPKGDTVYYTYDGLGRLQYVKDAQGKLLTDYQYHYKN